MSRHHWIYAGCQCSSARCSRLLLDRPTLLGIFSAEIISRAPCYVLGANVPRATCTRADVPIVLRATCGRAFVLRASCLSLPRGFRLQPEGPCPCRKTLGF